MEVDQDEAYVSGLSSGAFASGGEVSTAPISLGSVSFTAEPEKEEKGKGQGGEKFGEKGLSRAPRKKVNPNRHSGAPGGGGYTGSSRDREMSPGILGSGSRLPPGHLSTPTTQLSHQIHLMGLHSPVVFGGKRTLAERQDDSSPMNSEDGAPSLSDAGYGSLPLSSLTEEKGGNGSAGDATASGGQMTALAAPKPRGMP